MPHIHIRMDDRAVQNALKKMVVRSLDYRPVFEWARRQLAAEYAENFLTRGANAGKPWMPLDDEYFRWKISHYGPRPDLVLQGGLRRDLSTLRGAPNSIHPRRAVFGTQLQVAKWHQHGTRHMPAREIVFVPRHFAAEFGKKAAAHILRPQDTIPVNVLKGLLPS